MPKAELYIGNLSKDATRKDIENVFDKYGRLLRCDIKNKGYNGSVYAFLEFEHERDAEDALKCENGKEICGSSILIEWAKSKKEKRPFREARYGRNGFSRSSRSDGRSLECYTCGRRGHFARDCKEDKHRRSDRDRHGDHDRDRRRNRDRHRSRSRSRSKTRSKSRSRSRSRSRS